MEYRKYKQRKLRRDLEERKQVDTSRSKREHIKIKHSKERELEVDLVDFLSNYSLPKQKRITSKF